MKKELANCSQMHIVLYQRYCRFNYELDLFSLPVFFAKLAYIYKTIKSQQKIEL